MSSEGDHGWSDGVVTGVLFAFVVSTLAPIACLYLALWTPTGDGKSGGGAVFHLILFLGAVPLLVGLMVVGLPVILMIRQCRRDLAGTRRLSFLVIFWALSMIVILTVMSVLTLRV